MSNLDLWIENDRWSQVVRIFIKERLGNKTHIIHSLNNRGKAAVNVVEGCAYGERKPYVTMPSAIFRALEKEMFADNKRILEDEIVKLKGEVAAKDAHIINLNEIFDKTLSKIV